MRCSTPTLPSSWKVIAFTTNMVMGLAISQFMGASLEHDAYETYVEVVTAATMWCLAFIMINVGYEFTIDKQNLSEYFTDYCVAMTAAGFPWIFVGFWFFYALGTDMAFDESLLIARFAAPTSAGILFSMLDAAGLKDTWVYQKARILAIFDDLDTIILMIPLKILMVGFKWELTVVVGIMAMLLVFSWVKLHSLKLPYSWPWTVLYAGVVAALCKVIHHITEHNLDMEPIHIEVLLPAFVIGTVIDTPCARHELQLQRTMTVIRAALRASRSNEGGSRSFGLGPRRPSTQNLVANSENDDQDMKADLSVLRDSSQVSNMNPVSMCTSVYLDDEQLEEIRLDDDDVIRKSAERSMTRPPGWVLDTSDGKHSREVANAVAISTAAKRPVALTSPLAQSVGSSLSSDAANEYESRIRKGSKQSTGSKLSAASSRSSRSLTRYGIPRDNVIRTNAAHEPEAEPVPDAHHEDRSCTSKWEDCAQLTISLIFMVLVGLSMPALIGENAEDQSGGLGAGAIAFHVVSVSILMILGKMFPIVCYRDESNLKGRTALCLGMCPRGEVGASIIVISLELGVSGPAVIVAMSALAGNLVMSGGFIALVKTLLRDAPPFSLEGEQVTQTPVGDMKVLTPVQELDGDVSQHHLEKGI